MTVSPMATGQTRTGGQAEELLSWVTPRRHRASAMRPQDIHLAPQPPKARKPGAQQHQSARQAAVEAAEAAAEVAAEDPLSPRRPPKKVAAVPVFSSKQISQSKNPLRNALGGSGGAAGWGAVTKNIVDPNRFEKVKKEVVRQQVNDAGPSQLLALGTSFLCCVCVCCVCGVCAVCVLCVCVRTLQSAIAIVIRMARSACVFRWDSAFRVTTWTILQKDGPNHLGLRCNAFHEHQMALITSDCVPFMAVRRRSGRSAKCWPSRTRSTTSSPPSPQCTTGS